MNLRALRTFVTTAEVGGLGRACVRLNISQPAASRHIHALEYELGVVLFERVGRGLKLTSEGENLLRRSRRLLDDASSLFEHARTLKGGQTGTLKIAATPQVIAGVLAEFLPLHQKRHAGVEIQLVEGGGASQPMRLERGEVHLAIMPSGNQSFQGRLLYPVHALAVFRKDSQLTSRRVLEVASLANEPILLLHRDFGSREWFDAACTIANLRPHVRLESAAPQTLIKLAAAGYGVAVVPSTADIQNETVLALPLVHNGMPLGRWSRIAWNPQRMLPPYAKRFADELVAFTRRKYPGQKLTRRAPQLPRPPELAM
jgi:LysR family cyn operon transcriptional activator